MQATKMRDFLKSAKNVPQILHAGIILATNICVQNN